MQQSAACQAALLQNIRQGRDTHSRPSLSAPERASEETTVVSTAHAKAVGWETAPQFERQQRSCGDSSQRTRGGPRKGRLGQGGDVYFWTSPRLVRHGKLLACLPVPSDTSPGGNLPS